MDKKHPTVTPAQLEEALADYVALPEVAKELGVSRQAIFKRADHSKRQMGGIKTPFGWIFRRDRFREYDPPTGRPTEASRRGDGPFLAKTATRMP